MTGVMSPGPITAATVGAGTKSPHAGVMVAFGHGIVEFPLMALIYFGLGDMLKIDSVRASVLSLGGIFLLFMGVDMFLRAWKATEIQNDNSRKPLTTGIMLSLGNAYFLIWWATVGASLLSKAVVFGLAGVMIFAFVHWSCDFVWFYILSAASYKGGSVFGLKFQKIVFAVCGAFLIVFGFLFLFDAGRIMFA